MAKLPVLCTVIFLLFTFSHARVFTSEREHDVTDLPEFDPESTTAILLPSERPGFEPPKLLDFKHDDDASETDSVSGVGSVPLTKISFHPVNRHFPRRPVLPFSHHHHHHKHHNCHYNKRFRPLNPRFNQDKHVFSYGNDMIVSDESRFDPESRGVVRQIEARWGKFHDDGSESKHHVEFMKHHHHDHHDHDQDHEDEHEHYDLEHDRENEHHDQEHDHEHEHHDQEHDHEHEHHDQEHELHHEHEHEVDHHHHHHHHHKHHHHHGEEDERDHETEQHKGGLMEKFRKLFIHF